MEVISNCARAEVKRAAKSLKDGHLVAFPTETVYGLGADASNSEAVDRIYRVKGRPRSHPLIIHISSIKQLKKWAIEIPDYAVKLAKDFWPGPMTLILSRSHLAKNFVTGGQDLVALRVPSHPIALMLLKEFEYLGGLGIAAPSANRFGAVSPTNAMAVVQELGNFLSEFDLILSAGQSEVGIESTIVDCTSKAPNILRPGVITKELINEKIGIETTYKISRKKINAPGLLNVHYSPVARVILDREPSVGDGFYAMAEFETPKGVIRLGAPQTIKEYAQNLYLSLRLADQKKLKQISVYQPPGNGLAVAIRDRLSKSAAK